MKQQDKVFMIMGATVITLTATVAGVYLFAKENTTSSLPTPTVTTATVTPSTTTSIPTTSPTTSSSMMSNSGSVMYKDGIYSATATYYVPGAANSVTAKITIASDKITDVSVSNNYADRQSGYYIDSFVSSIKSAVVGKSIASLNLSRIGGATLTTNGFSSALDSIISQAKA